LRCGPKTSSWISHPGSSLYKLKVSNPFRENSFFIFCGR
jgi:hypothetical protein